MNIAVIQKQKFRSPGIYYACVPVCHMQSIRVHLIAFTRCSVLCDAYKYAYVFSPLLQFIELLIVSLFHQPICTPLHFYLYPRLSFSFSFLHRIKRCYFHNSSDGDNFKHDLYSNWEGVITSYTICCCMLVRCLFCIWKTMCVRHKLCMRTNIHVRVCIKVIRFELKSTLSCGPPNNLCSL